MRQTCIVTSCTNFACKTSDVDFFYLPADRAKARTWLKVLRRTDLCKALGRFDYHVCARHFSQRQYSNNSNFSRPRLVPHAVPDKCLPNEAGKEEEHGSIAEQKPSVKLSATTLNRVEIPCNSAVSYDNAEHDEVQDSHVVDGLQLKLEHTQAPLPPQLKDIPGVAGLQKKVVRLRLPPGMSVKEFAASEAMKNITNKLSGLVDNSSDTNKTFVLKLQAPQGNTDSSGASGSSIQDAKTQDVGVTSNDNTEPLVNMSSSIAPTKLKMIRIAKNGHLAGGFGEGSSGSGAKTTFMTLRGRKASRIALEDDTDDDDDDDESYEVQSSKRMYSGSSLNSAIQLVKRTKLHHTDTGSSSGGDGGGGSTHEKQYTLSEVRADGSSVAACSREEPYTLSSSLKTDRSNKSLVGHDASKTDSRILGMNTRRPTTIQGYHTQLIMKQAKREQLIRKIRQQKELLLQRGKELCRYRLQLKRIRDNRSRLSEMTLPECLRILKGNMHEHALELLYTQLVGQDERGGGTAAVAAASTAGSSGAGTGQSAGEGQSENGAAAAAATTEDVVYTPKVLESALLFSVAGKKAYKAMCQSLKLPPYSDIIKWKKIIRSDPPFYKKHFPNLRAKFFKRRRTEEKKPKKRGQAVEEEEQDGWNTDGECVKRNDATSKSEENNSISPEEAEHLYQKLLAEQEKFERIFVEDNQTPDDMASLEEADLPDLPIDDYDIDLDVDATEFIKRLRQKEKLNLCGEEQWERELEQLHEMEADDLDSSLTNRNHGDNVSSDLQSVNEVINRVINKVVKNVTTSSGVVDDSNRHASTVVATPGCSSSGGGNVIPIDTPTIEISSASVVTLVDSHGDTLPDIESGPDANGADNHHHDTLFMADDDGAIIAQTSDGEKLAYVPAQGTAVTTGQDSMSTSSFVSTVDVGPSSAVVTNTIADDVHADNRGVRNIVYLRVPAVGQQRGYTVSEEDRDEATPGPSMPKIF